MRGTSYKGKLQLSFSWSINGKMQEIIEEIVGEIPIMIKVFMSYDWNYVFNCARIAVKIV